MKRVWIAIVVVLVALAGVIGWQVSKPSNEPVYEGRTLTSWLRLYAEREGHVASVQVGGQTWVTVIPGVDDALGHLGREAIPTLLRLLRTKDPPLKKMLLSLARHQHIVEVSTLSDDAWHYAAWAAFVRLRFKTEPAVPSLVEIVNQNISTSSREYAFESLLCIDPPEEWKAIPDHMLLWTTNADPELRLLSIKAVGRAYRLLEQVVPVLVRALRDSSPKVEDEALGAFFDNFRDGATDAVPDLVRILDEGPSPFSGANVCMALGGLGPAAAGAAPAALRWATHADAHGQVNAMVFLRSADVPAKVAVPALLQWVTSTNTDVRGFSRYLLYELDRGAAAKAGITDAPPEPGF